MTKHADFRPRLILMCLVSCAMSLIPIGVGADSTTGLIGYWRFDDASGTTARDASGNGNTGTLTNGPTWTTGKFNGAIDFDGNNDYVSVANESNFDFERTDPFSIAMWIYRDTNTNENDPCGKCDQTNNWQGYCMWLPPSSSCSNCLQFDINSGLGGGDSITFRTAAGTVPLSTWTHVAVTYSGSSTLAGLKVYINGVSVTASSSSDGLTSSILNNNNFVIGAEAPNVTEKFDGKIDDVRVYNRALTAGDVQSVYNIGAVIRNGVVRNGSLNP